MITVAVERSINGRILHTLVQVDALPPTDYGGIKIGSVDLGVRWVTVIAREIPVPGRPMPPSAVIRCRDEADDEPEFIERLLAEGWREGPALA